MLSSSGNYDAITVDPNCPSFSPLVACMQPGGSLLLTMMEQSAWKLQGNGPVESAASRAIKDKHEVH